MAHPVDRALEDRHVRPEADRDHRRVVADDAAADDQDAARRDARHAAEQQTSSAQRLLEEVSAGLCRKATTHIFRDYHRPSLVDAREDVGSEECRDPNDAQGQLCRVVRH